MYAYYNVCGGARDFNIWEMKRDFYLDVYTILKRI